MYGLEQFLPVVLYGTIIVAVLEAILTPKRFKQKETKAEKEDMEKQRFFTVPNPKDVQGKGSDLKPSGWIDAHYPGDNRLGGRHEPATPVIPATPIVPATPIFRPKKH